MGSVHQINPIDALRVFHNDVVIYWKKTGTVCEECPQFIRIEGVWYEYDEQNQVHVDKMNRIKSAVELAKVIPITGNKKQ